MSPRMDWSGVKKRMAGWGTGFDEDLRKAADAAMVADSLCLGIDHPNYQEKKIVTIQCRFCGFQVEASPRSCPHCGGPK